MLGKGKHYETSHCIIFFVVSVLQLSLSEKNSSALGYETDLVRIFLPSFVKDAPQERVVQFLI
jgi:hypothetical protein